MKQPLWLIPASIHEKRHLFYKSFYFIEVLNHWDIDLSSVWFGFCESGLLMQFLLISKVDNIEKITKMIKVLVLLQ